MKLRIFLVHSSDRIITDSFSNMLMVNWRSVAVLLLSKMVQKRRLFGRGVSRQKEWKEVDLSPETSAY